VVDDEGGEVFGGGLAGLEDGCDVFRGRFGIDDDKCCGAFRDRFGLCMLALSPLFMFAYRSGRWMVRSW
jgi:hypothetical protein